MCSFWEFFSHNENQKFIEQKEFSLRNKFLQSDSPFFYLFELIFEWNRLYISIHDPFEVMKIRTLYLIRPFCKSLYNTSNTKGSIFSYTLKKLKKQMVQVLFPRYFQSNFATMLRPLHHVIKVVFMSHLVELCLLKIAFYRMQ